MCTSVYTRHGQPFSSSGPHKIWFIKVDGTTEKIQGNFSLKRPQPFSLQIRITICLRGKFIFFYEEKFQYLIN